jgi:hypothetical protein
MLIVKMNDVNDSTLMDRGRYFSLNLWLTQIKILWQIS